jgi:hypothetical protein
VASFDTTDGVFYRVLKSDSPSGPFEIQEQVEGDGTRHEWSTTPPDASRQAEFYKVQMLAR